ncbi:MAG: sigma-70 family RNA polymerase sigma factor [Acidobacteria bacterium]|nr:MAG: sigma-70 family RNA polymerase sigma factor [Acidobacteriota bacterium]
MANALPFTPSLPDLVALRRHDPEVLASVVAENAPVLYRVARAWGVPEADADDLVQETFVTFLSGLDRFEGRSQLPHLAVRHFAQQNARLPPHPPFRAAFH